MKKYILIFLLAFISLVGIAQPFANEIAAFKKLDAVAPPPKHAILFVGSSSFTNWKDVSTYFPGYPIINRGFGGSSLTDVIRYADDVIFPYSLKQIVIYCGENDIAGSDTVSAKTVLHRYATLHNMIREKMPAVPILFISIKPSPSRWQMRDRMKEANKLIKKFSKRQPNTSFVSVWKAMLADNGEPMKDIFIGDNLHMNAKGYHIWQKLIAPYLVK